MEKSYLLSLTVLLAMLFSSQTFALADDKTPATQTPSELAETKEAFMTGCKFLEARANLCRCVWNRLEKRFKAEQLITLHKTNEYPEAYKPFVKNVIHHCARGY